MRHSTYNTGKVHIGLAYQRKPRTDMSLDEEKIQTALLSKGKPSYLGILSYASIVAVAVAAAITAIN